MSSFERVICGLSRIYYDYLKSNILPIAKVIHVIMVITIILSFRLEVACAKDFRELFITSTANLRQSKRERE